jgi:hypothetical protein
MNYAKKIIRSDEKKPFGLDVNDWCFHLCYYDHHHNSVDLWNISRRGFYRNSILLQIRRLVFYDSVNIFLIFMIYFFSKFGQLRIKAKRQALNLNTWFAMLFSKEWGLIYVLEYQSLFTIFL